MTGRASMRAMVLAVVCLTGFAGASALALYYRAQALGFERKWRQLAAVYRASQAAPPANRGPVREEEVEWGDEVPAGILSPAMSAAPAVAEPEPAGTQINMPRGGPEDRRGSPRWGGDWLAGVRTNDPARYEAMQKRREKARQQADNAYAGATNYFLYRDTQNMSDSDKEEFLRMLTLLQETRTMIQQMQAGLPPEDRRTAMSTVRSNIVELTPLLNSERDQEMFDLAVSMGHSETEADRMVAYIKQIASNTSLRVIFPDLPHRGRSEGPPAPRP